MPGRFEIEKTGPDTHEVKVGVPGKIEKGKWFRYRLTVEAERVENIDMDPREWENREVKDGKVVITGNVRAWDSVRAINITSARCEVREGSDIPSFNVVYRYREEGIRETLATMQKDYTWYVNPWANPMVKAGVGIAGVAVATGIVGRWLDWW